MNAPLTQEAQETVYLARLGERYMHDASSGVLPEETALEWCQDWLGRVRERLSQPA